MNQTKAQKKHKTCRVFPLPPTGQSKRRRAPGTGRMSYVREPESRFFGGWDTTQESGRMYLQLSNEKNPGWLDYIGDEILPSYIGIIIKSL